MIDESTGRIICELDNPMRDPGDGTIISATNISIITYAGDGQWCRQEDIYNPLRFVSATVKWCRKAEELGTLPAEAAAWMKQYADVRSTKDGADVRSTKDGADVRSTKDGADVRSTKDKGAK